ncbi:uncharacterized protein LOC125943550 [Dermacentor silvarum]|uniref:uncharacterized protein LOC125943550 n=1 Tax=Dermacentor silvarum TaxID=543639 RepID=UPI0021018061|nr:uncharacterized protein LOC125943550 [Dermacentor silvarum]
MDEMNRHGRLVIDEMKLSTHLDLKSTTDIEGFVNLGQFTEAQDKHTKADHGLVVIFQPFVGKWTQVIGVFASNGNAILLCERAGLHVDYICTDGASWNRAMWHSMGVHGNAKHVRCKVTHPCDKKRFLHFISDFPHLVKCVRNTMIRHGFNTHKGRVCILFHCLHYLKCRAPGKQLL